MGYFLTTEHRRRMAGESLARPKTHTPGSQVSNLGQRYYSPVLVRWINRDPIGIAAASALYQFVGNDPVNAVPRKLPGMDPGAKREDRVRPANIQNGTATCNQHTGNVDVQINNETCAGNCVASHEQIHVRQQSSCCQALAAACTANPSQCNAYIAQYNVWMSANENTMECLAYTDSLTCYWRALRTPQLQNDCECYQQMQAQLPVLGLLKQFHCTQGSLPMTPCPSF